MKWYKQPHTITGMRKWFEDFEVMTNKTAYYPYALELLFKLNIVEKNIFNADRETDTDKSIKHAIQEYHYLYEKAN